MPQGRHTRLTVALSPADRQTLQDWQRSATIPAWQARRGRIILLLADGVPLTHIAERVGISRRFVYKWVARFLAQGVDGLRDLPRPKPAHRRRDTARGDDVG